MQRKSSEYQHIPRYSHLDRIGLTVMFVSFLRRGNTYKKFQIFKLYGINPLADVMFKIWNDHTFKKNISKKQNILFLPDVKI